MTDYESRPAGAHEHPDVRSCPLDFNRGNAGGEDFFADNLPDGLVLLKKELKALLKNQRLDQARLMPKRYEFGFIFCAICLD